MTNEMCFWIDSPSHSHVRSRPRESAKDLAYEFAIDAMTEVLAGLRSTWATAEYKPRPR